VGVDGGGCMAGKGKECYYCREQTLHDLGSFSHCSNCDFVGWDKNQDVKAHGKGTGYKCWKCDTKTLQYLFKVGRHEVYRCRVCKYTALMKENKSSIIY
jgi:hypothetical protein